MRRLCATLGIVAALGLAGCGEGGAKQKSSATTAAPVTVAPGGSDQANTPFCQLARTVGDKIGTVALSANDPAKLKAASVDADSSIRQALATAPPAIKSDVQVVATTASDLLAALQKNNFDINKVPEQTAKLQARPFQDAFSNMNAYIQAHCGVS